MYHPIVKELVLPGLQEGQQTSPDTTETLSNCQALVKIVLKSLLWFRHTRTCGSPLTPLSKVILSFSAMKGAQSFSLRPNFYGVLAVSDVPQNRRGSTRQGLHNSHFSAVHRMRQLDRNEVSCLEPTSKWRNATTSQSRR
jgi:hypothetical protein